MKKYNELTKKPVVPQTQPLSSNQVKNNQGGYVYQVGIFNQLLRFLIIGSDNGSYYSSAKDLTKANVNSLRAAISEDYVKTVDLITSVSVEARAPSNDTALFALAVVASSEDVNARKYALSKLNAIARTGTHLFIFVHYVNGMRGWGDALVNAVTDWYTSKSPETLALQVIKYAQREGWSHRDVLRLSHPKIQDPSLNAIIKYAVKGTVDDNTHQLILGREALQSASNANEVLSILRNNPKLPREVIPTIYLNDTKIWKQLLDNGMPYTAMLRNLGKISSLGITQSNTDDYTQLILSQLVDTQAIARSKVHPLAILTALYVYSAGKGVKGNLSWTPNRKIIDALNAAFYKSFGNVTPTGKKILIGLDVSASMTWTNLNGIPNFTARAISAAMALVTMNIEPRVDVMAFSGQMIPIPITPTMRLDEVINTINRMPAGGTDCSLPMEYALKGNVAYDAFHIYTDNETYVGRRHPSVALQEVRKKFNNNAKLAVMALEGNPFSIADPNDVGMLDFVGMDASLPQILSEFMKM